MIRNYEHKMHVLPSQNSSVSFSKSFPNFSMSCVVINALLSSSGLGPGQVRVRKLRELKTQGFGPEPYNKIGFHHPPHKLFSWLLRGLDKSDGPRMGWYDSGMVKGG